MNQAEIERILADFRAWLEALRAFEPLADSTANGAAHHAPSVDLSTLVGQFVALKQEVNLQTRASRGQLEQNGQALEQLRQTLELLESRQENADNDEKLRPLLKSLVDSHDALSLARREVKKIHDGLHLLLAQVVQEPAPQRKDLQPVNPPPAINVTLPWWARLLGLGKHVDAALTPYRSWYNQQKEPGPTLVPRDQPEPEAYALAQRIRQGIQSILTGYGMSLQRLERALEQRGLEPIAAVGELFDPEQMEALEVVHDPERAPGEVADEIRRGYLWHGKVFRFAQVRVSQ